MATTLLRKEKLACKKAHELEIDPSFSMVHKKREVLYVCTKCGARLWQRLSRGGYAYFIKLFIEGRL